MKTITNQVFDYLTEFNIANFNIEVKPRMITVQWEQDYILCSKTLFENDIKIWEKLLDQFQLTRDLIRAKHGALTKEEFKKYEK